jgi:hypothetical protein
MAHEDARHGRLATAGTPGSRYAGVRELNEMTIGRTDDPENPFCVTAIKVAALFGTGSRTPSGPAVINRVEKAAHMIAVDPPVKLLIFLLASEGPSTHDTEGPTR